MLKKSYALALFSVISWASAPVIFKSLVSGMDFQSAVFFFLVFGSISMFVTLLVKGAWGEVQISTDKIKYILMLGFAYFIHYTAYCYSLSASNASTVIVLVKLSPIFQIIFASILLKEKTSGKSWLIFFLGFIGAAIVMLNGSMHLNISMTYITAIIAGIASAISVIFMVSIEKSKTNSYAALGWSLLVAAMFMGISLGLKGSFVFPHGSQWLWLVYLGFVPTGLAVVAWAKAMSIAAVHKIANLDYLTPATGVFFSWLILGEKVSIYLIFGLSIILGSIYFNSRFNSNNT